MKHGGKRAGAGAPTKDPSGRHRVKWSGWLPAQTMDQLRVMVQAGRFESQSDAIAKAVESLDRGNVG